MTRISASCPRSPERGFTLLELLLVLALAATAATLVLPSTFTALRAADERQHVAQVEAMLTRLPHESAIHREPRQWTATALMARLPDRSAPWQLRLDAPLHFDARGLTAGGRVQLWQGERVAQRWILRAGDGKPQRMEPGEADAR